MFDPLSSCHLQPTVPDIVPALWMTFHLHHMSFSRLGPIPDLLPQTASQRPPHTPSWQIPPTRGDVTPTDDGAATSLGVLRSVMLFALSKAEPRNLDMEGTFQELGMCLLGGRYGCVGHKVERVKRG